MTSNYRHALLATLMALVPVAASAQAGTLFVEGDNVGIGTASPSASLHVQKNDGSSQLLIEELSGTTQVREMLRLSNNGGPFFVFSDSSTAKSYSFALSGSGDFIVSHQQTPGIQLRLSPSGNLTIPGSLTQGSSRDYKETILPIDSQAILDKVAELPVATWKYKQDDATVRHLGPMAEDFHAAFGLGATEKGISSLDSSGVALAAIQGLYDLVKEQRAEIDALNAKIAELEAASELAEN